MNGDLASIMILFSEWICSCCLVSTICFFLRHLSANVRLRSPSNDTYSIHTCSASCDRRSTTQRRQLIPPHNFYPTTFIQEHSPFCIYDDGGLCCLLRSIHDNEYCDGLDSTVFYQASVVGACWNTASLLFSSPCWNQRSLCRNVISYSEI